MTSDPGPTRARWQRAADAVRTAERSALVRAVRSAVLALPPVSRASRAVRWSWVAVPAAVTAGHVSVVMRRSEEPVAGTTVAATAVAGGSLALAVGMAALWCDARLERWLVRRGVPAPRVVIAVAAGGSRLALSGLARRHVRRAGPTDG